MGKDKKACKMSPRWIGNMEKANEKVKEKEWENIIVLELKDKIYQVPEMEITWN